MQFLITRDTCLQFIFFDLYLLWESIHPLKITTKHKQKQKQKQRKTTTKNVCKTRQRLQTAIKRQQQQHIKRQTL
jgi:hypothetical protein